MKITVKKTKFKTVRQGDPNWMLDDGIMVCPRAGFEINASCPYGYQQVIQECIDKGWLKPVANVYGKELTLDAMR